MPGAAQAAPNTIASNRHRGRGRGSGYSRSNRGTGQTSDPNCFLRGTHIQTDRGDVAVEALKIGDRVRTRDGSDLPVRWIGRRRYRRGSGRWPEAVEPIRIRRGAIADDVPRRDLYVSPLHRLHFEGYLMPARDLVNDATVLRGAPDDATAVEYFHILLDRHAVIVAEGVEAESLCYRPGCEETYANFAEFRRLFGDSKDAVPSCLPTAGYWGGRAHLRALLRLGVSPVVDVPDPVRRVNRRLAERAVALADM